MKNYLNIFRVMLLCLTLSIGYSAPAMAQSYKQSSSSQKTAQQKAAEQKKKEAAKKKAAAQKAKDKQKAAQAKEKAKAQADREKAQAQRQKALDEKEQAKIRREKKLYNQDLHFVSMWGGVGYSGLYHGYKPTESLPMNDGTFTPKFIGGGGGIIGLGYEYHHENFMLKLGPEFRIFSSQDNLNFNDAFYIPQPDYPAEMTQYYTFSKLHETQTVGQVMLPILAGMNFENKYYFLAGVKIGYTVMDFWRQNGRLSTTIHDEMAYDEIWEQMAGHFIMNDAKLKDHPLFDGAAKGKNKLAQGLDAAISLEGGVYLNEFLSPDWQSRNEESAHPWWFRLGAFLDFGLPIQSIAKSANPNFLSTGELVNDKGATQTTLSTQSLHSSSLASGKLGSVLVGVKLTAAWQVNKPQQPNPRLIMQVRDQFTGRPIAAAKVSIQAEGKKKAQLKTMRRDGSFTNRYPAGNYTLTPQAEGYLDGAPRLFEHATDMMGDTVIFTLIPKPLLTVFVHDSKTERLIPAQLSFVSNEHGDTVQAQSSVEQEAKVGLQYGDTYRIAISAAGYHPDTASVSDLYSTQNYYLTPIVRVRRVLILKNMYFATDKTDILPMSDPELQKLYNFLSENDKIRVLITGHTDSQGSDAYNQRLSEGRANSVKAEMVKRGIAADRIDTDGKGESEPIDTNETEEGRQNNRRIEVTVLNAEDAIVDEY